MIYSFEIPELDDCINDHKMMDYIMENKFRNSFPNSRFRVDVFVVPDNDIHNFSNLYSMVKIKPNNIILFYTEKKKPTVIHSDHGLRESVINIPIQGDWDNAPFYIFNGDIDMNYNLLDDPANYVDTEFVLDGPHYLNHSTCYDVVNPHGPDMRNTNMDRIVLSMSYGYPYTVNKIYDMYTSGKLLA